MTRQGWQCPLCEVVYNPETKRCECTVVPRCSAPDCSDPNCYRHPPCRDGGPGRRAMDHTRARAFGKEPFARGDVPFHREPHRTM